MLICAKKTSSIEEGKKMLEENIKNGKGIEKLKEFVKAQGGDISPIDNFDKFPKAKYIKPVICEKEGYISKIHAESFGLIAMELGAGRATKESEIDLAVGIVLNKKRGDKVCKGDILAYIHANDESKIDKAERDIIDNMVITDVYNDCQGAPPPRDGEREAGSLPHWGALPLPQGCFLVTFLFKPGGRTRPSPTPSPDSAPRGGEEGGRAYWVFLSSGG